MGPLVTGSFGSKLALMQHWHMVASWGGRRNDPPWRTRGLSRLTLFLGVPTSALPDGPSVLLVKPNDIFLRFLGGKA